MTRLLQGLTALVGVLMVLAAAVNVGAFAGRHEWLSLADRERWTPAMVERRSLSDREATRRADATGFYGFATSTMSNAIIMAPGREYGYYSPVGSMSLSNSRPRRAEEE